MDEEGPRRYVGAASWTGWAAFAFGVFAVLGFAIAGLVFAQAPNWWSGSALTAVAAGLGGASAWLLVCGRAPRPAWWRAGVAGALAGVLLHPYYWLIAFSLTLELPSIANLLQGILFSLSVVGVITVPAGVLAGLSCRALASLRRVG
jgi:hypothetical protein